MYKVFWLLLKTDIEHIFKNMPGNVLNLLCWTICSLFVNVYVMQRMGVPSNYSELIAGSMIVSTIYFQMIPHIFTNVADYCGDRIIQYQLTLPIAPKLVFIKQMCTYAINGVIFGVITLCVCKAVLFYSISLSKICWWKFIIALTLSSAFFGSFTMWVSSVTQYPSKIGDIINRLLFPLWFLGGFLFPWVVLYRMLPWAALLNLLNPYVHMTEALRGAMVGPVLGGDVFLPFWYSCGALIVFTSIFGFWAVVKLKKRLDFV